jgi:four helix bundle protein
MEASNRKGRFEDLLVWNKAQNLGQFIYELTATGNLAKDFSLKDQIRRAVLSISSNIAEGQGRYSNKEFRRYLAIANGSTYEVISLIRFAQGVGHMTQIEADRVIEKCSEISRMIKGLRNSIKG